MSKCVYCPVFSFSTLGAVSLRRWEYGLPWGSGRAAHLGGPTSEHLSRALCPLGMSRADHMVVA